MIDEGDLYGVDERHRRRWAALIARVVAFLTATHEPISVPDWPCHPTLWQPRPVDLLAPRPDRAPPETLASRRERQAA
jgi:hypothetical protein